VRKTKTRPQNANADADHDSEIGPWHSEFVTHEPQQQQQQPSAAPADGEVELVVSALDAVAMAMDSAAMDVDGTTSLAAPHDEGPPKLWTSLRLSRWSTDDVHSETLVVEDGEEKSPSFQCDDELLARSPPAATTADIEGLSDELSELADEVGNSSEERYEGERHVAHALVRNAHALVRNRLGRVFDTWLVYLLQQHSDGTRTRHEKDMERDVQTPQQQHDAEVEDEKDRLSETQMQQQKERCGDKILAEAGSQTVVADNDVPLPRRIPYPLPPTLWQPQPAVSAPEFLDVVAPPVTGMRRQLMQASEFAHRSVASARQFGNVVVRKIIAYLRRVYGPALLAACVESAQDLEMGLKMAEGRQPQITALQFQAAAANAENGTLKSLDLVVELAPRKRQAATAPRHVGTVPVPFDYRGVCCLPPVAAATAAAGPAPEDADPQPEDAPRAEKSDAVWLLRLEDERRCTGIVNEWSNNSWALAVVQIFERDAEELGGRLTLGAAS